MTDYEGGWFEEAPDPPECDDYWHISSNPDPARCPTCGDTDPLDND